MKTIFLRILPVIFFPIWASAASVNWINPSGGNWSDPTSWSSGAVPGAADDVAISLSGTYSVLLDVTATIQSLALGGSSGVQTLANNSGTLTVGSGVVGANGVLAVGGGTVSGAIVIQGTLTWSGGNIAGVTTVDSNSVLNILGGSGRVAGLVLTNYGTVNWTNTDLYGGSGTQIYNYGLWDAQSDNEFYGTYYNGAAAVFDNFGTFHKSGNTGTTTLDGSVAFNNTGTVDVESGTLALNGGGAGNGAFEVASTASLSFGGGYIGGSFPTDLGNFQLNGGTLTVNQPITAQSVAVSAGTLALNGVLSSTNIQITGGTLSGTNVIEGTLTWSGGNIAGVTTVDSNSVLNILGGSGRVAGLVLTNYGTVNWTYTDLYGGSGTQIYNYGLWEAQSDNEFYGTYYNGAAAVFDNFGTFRKSGNAGTTTTDGSVAFNNSGTVDVENGTLAVNGGGVGNGAFEVANAANVSFGAGYTGGNFPSGSVQLKAGTLTVNGALTSANFQLVGGTLVGTNVLVGTVTWSGGNIAGVTTVGSNSVLNILGGSGRVAGLVLTNYGTVNWTNTDLYGGSGTKIYNYGLWDAQSDNEFYGIYYNGAPAVFDNFGTLRKSGNTGTTTLDSGTDFNNTGTVDVESGTLALNGGGAGNGPFDVASAANLSFGAGYTGGYFPAGLGNFQLNGGTLTVNQPITAQSVTISAGTLALNGVLSSTNIQITGGTLAGTNVLVGTLTWTGGNMTGVTTVGSNSVLNIFGGSGRVAGLVLTNYGTVNWTNTDLYGGSGTKIYNYGLWEAQSDNEFYGTYYNGAAAVFDNFGTFRKSGNAGTTTLDGSVAFNNTGTVDAQDGVITLNATYTFAGGTLNFGINSLTNFGRINLPGAAALAGTLGASFNNGYSPIAGNSFPVLTYGSTNGAFTNFSLPGGIAWQPIYGASTLTLAVLNVAPTLVPPVNQSVRELTLLTAAESATDHDLPPQTLTFGLVSGPAGLTVNPQSGLISWTPAQTQSPSTNTIVVKVTDTGTPPLSTSNSFQVVVVEVNKAPVLGSLPGQSVIQQNLITITNTAAESNIHATLGYSLVNPPAGASIDANGVIRWIPSPAQSPSTNIIVTVVTNTDLFDLVNPNLSATNSVTVIARAIPILTWAAPADINYGTALSAAQLDATANVAGTFVYSPPIGTVLTAGANQNLMVTFTPSDTSGYAAASATVKLNVHQAAPVITWNNPGDITYGTPLGAAQLNATASVAGSFAYSPPSGTVLAAGSSQSISVLFSPSDNIDYAPVTVNAGINVLPATLTVTANSTNRLAGAANPVFTATITGFVNGDGVAVVSGSPNLATTATASSPAGSYPITVAQGTLSAMNYLFATFVPGTLTVASPPSTGGRWIEKAPMPVGGWSSGTAPIGGLLYVEGGNNGGPLSTLYAYNPVLDSWTNLANMPGARYQGDGAGVISNQLYVAGGWTTSPPLPNNNLWVYDPAANSWQTKASLPLLSAGGATVVVSNLLYVTTPDDGFSGYYNFLHVYNPANDSWTALASSPDAHAGPGFGVISNLFYLVGGLNGSGIVSNRLDVYNPASNSWRTLSPMPTSRQGPATAVLNGQLWVIGGLDTAGNVLATVEAYDPTADTWTTQTPMPTARTSPSASVINGVIYVVGGISGGIPLATNEAFALLPPVPALTGPSLESGVFSVSVGSTTGFSYTLEYKPSLNIPVWADAQSVPGTGGLITLTDTNAMVSTRFYRVRVQ